MFSSILDFLGDVIRELSLQLTARLLNNLANQETNDSVNWLERQSSDCTLDQVGPVGDSDRDAGNESRWASCRESTIKVDSGDSLAETAQVLSRKPLQEDRPVAYNNTMRMATAKSHRFANAMFAFSSEIQVERLSAKADSAEERFKRLGDLKDVDEAIECRTQILSLTPDGHTERPQRLHAFGGALLVRFRYLGELADLNKAIEYQAQAVQLTPNGHSDRAYELYNLGSSYHSQFMILGELANLNKAIDYLTEAVQLTPDGHADKPGRLTYLAISYNSLSIHAPRKPSVQLTPDGHADKPGWLNNLGISYQSRFLRLGELADLNKAIDYLAEAVQLTPDGHSDKPGELYNLGNSYQFRFMRLGELTDLNVAIDYQNQAVQLTPDGHTDKPGQLNCLGNSYYSRFMRFGELTDLNNAIGYQTQAVQLTPDGYADKPGVLYSLGNSYQSRFTYLGELAALDKAIDYLIQAAELTSAGHPDKPRQLNSLGISYHYRFMRLGVLADLNKAIDYQTEVVHLTPDWHSDKPRGLYSLGNSYQSRFWHLGELADLNKAIECHARSVQLTPDGHTDKPGVLYNLGNSYQSRFTRLGELEDLNKAIEYQTQAVKLAPDARSDSWLNSLGISYHSRFRVLGELADVNKAIECHTRAVQLTPGGHADKPSGFYNLGNSHHSRFMCLGEVSDLESAESFFQRGAQLVITRPQSQIECARKWAKSLSQLGQSPRLAYERCMEIVPHLIWLGTTIDRRYQVLREINDLATDAAAWAISTQQLDLALEWLEEGRSVVWNQILQLRTPFDELSSVDPELAQQLKAISSELQSFGSQEGDVASATGPAVPDQSSHHQHLASKWDDLIGKARKLPGFQHFLRPRQAKSLKPAATDGPIVVINCHSTRCDALVIIPKSNNIAHIPLERFSATKAAQHRTLMNSLVGNRGDPARGLKLSNPQRRPEERFKPTLVTLWLDLVKPILDHLGYTHQVPADNLPHVTWCTTGALAFLPLHAAGCYNDSHSNTFNLVVSSYTPTLSALLTSGTVVTTSDIGVLAVGQENTSGFPPLPYTVHELAAIQERSRTVRFQRLDGVNGTVEAVLGALDKHSWVHLACHATQDSGNPTQSAFRLHNGDLTLEAITKCAFKNKGLAFLSACQTAAGDDKLHCEKDSTGQAWVYQIKVERPLI